MNQNNSIYILLRILNDPRVDPSYDDNWLLRSSVSHDHIEIIKSLLKDPRVDPSANHNEAIRIAALNGNYEIIDLLLEDPRVDPSVSGNFAIQVSANHAYVKVVKRLLKDPRVDPSVIADKHFTEQIKMHPYKKDKYMEIRELLERIEKDRIMKRCRMVKEEIMMKVWHPSRVERLLLHGYDIEDM